MSIMNYSLEQGYTFLWDGDMSDKGFTRKEGIAVVAELKDKDEQFKKHPIKEKHIDENFRQSEFDNFDVTDDHLMHIVGLVEDQNGVKYFKTKNSWGTDYKYNGFWNMSDEFVRLHTVAIMVNKNAIPKEIRKKLNL